MHWPLYLSFAQLSFNSKVSELTLSTPFALMFGRKMNDFIDYTQTKKEEQKVSLENWKQHQDEVLSLIYPQIELRARNVQKKYAAKLEKLRRNVLTRDLPPGTQVMILDEKYLKGTPKPNTEPKYIGKYTIVRREVNGPYIVKSMDGQVLHRKVPLDQMKVLFRPGAIPYMKDDEDVWIVQELINYKKEGNKDMYEVKWKGFDETTWEPLENIHDQNLVDVYWRKQAGRKQVGKKGKKNTNIVACVYLMARARDTLFNEADQTAQTHDKRLLEKIRKK